MLANGRADVEHAEVGLLSRATARRTVSELWRFAPIAALGSLALLLLSPALEVSTTGQLIALSALIGGLVLLQLRSLRLERELRQARVRALDAIDLERQRIQRDLHDSAQQRLVSVRIHLGLLAQRAEPS